VAARGTHDELLERSAVYREIVELGQPDRTFLNQAVVEDDDSLEATGAGRL
jgi:hypothetical protein